MSIDRAEMEPALGELARGMVSAPDYGHLTVFGWCADCEAPDGAGTPERSAGPGHD